MTIEGLIRLLEEQVKISRLQIRLCERYGRTDPYEKGFKDALQMVLRNLNDIDMKRREENDRHH